MRRLLPLTATAVGLVVLVAPAAQAIAAPTVNEVVYISDAGGDGSVVIRDLTSRTAKVVLPPDMRYVYESPELSPDAGSIAVATNRDSADQEEGIAVVTRTGSGLRRLTEPVSTETKDVFDAFPKWSPKGDRILFTRITLTYDASDDFVATSALFTVPTAGPATVTSVAGATRGFSGDWLTDSEIVYAALPTTQQPKNTLPDGGTLSRVATTPGATSSPLTQAATPSAFPAVSRDGQNIAYSTITKRDGARGDTAKIAVVAAAGTPNRILNATQPSSAPSFATSPTWTPDGRALVYERYGYDSDGPTVSDVWAIDSAGVRAGKVIASAGEDISPFVQGPVPGPVQPGAPSSFVPVTPQRILDTRKGVGGPTARVGPGGTRTLPIVGLTTSAGTVPADTTAVVLNVTLAGPSASTDVRVYPGGTAAPSASNVNAPRGSITPNLVTVRVGTDGAVVLKNGAGDVDLIADIAGYYTPEISGDRFGAVTPGRILDTRRAFGARGGKVAQTPLTLKVTGTLPTSTGGTVTVPADASAVVLNVTSTQSSLGTDVRVYPTADGNEPPMVSNLNVRAGKDTANLVTVQVGTGGTVQLFNRFGETHLVADIAGFYGGEGDDRGTDEFVPLSPTRFLDTRAGLATAPIPATVGGFVQVPVAGSRNVPATATAAVLNLTATSATGNTDVRAYPVGIGGTPLVSNLNLAKGETRANLAIVPVGAGGQLQVLNRSFSTNLIGDLAGYMVPGRPIG